MPTSVTNWDARITSISYTVILLKSVTKRKEQDLMVVPVPSNQLLYGESVATNRMGLSGGMLV